MGEKGWSEHTHGRNATQTQNYLTCGSKAVDIDVAVLNSFNTEGSVASLNTPQAQQQFDSSCWKSSVVEH